MSKRVSKVATQRLILRPFRREDAGEFTRLAGDWAVASMTSDIPFPFTQSEAMAWLRPVRGEVRFAIELQGRLIGGAGYYRRPSGAAELGFWLGRPWWGQGFATEAAQAVLRLGFKDPRLPGFTSAHFADNRASERVLIKLGFEATGRGTIACAARGADVPAVSYWLDRQRAKLNAPSLLSDAPRRSRWRTWLGRTETI
jgi:[ribosomal protein S5]-alanine N-acetyltransferase